MLKQIIFLTLTLLKRDSVCMNKLFDMDREQLRALAEYREVLETGRFFPRNFWQNEKNTNGIRLNCQAITRYCLEGIEGISANELPSRNLKQIKEILSKNRLMGMLQTVFHNDVLKVLINAYPEKFKKRELLNGWEAVFEQ